MTETSPPGFEPSLAVTAGRGPGRDTLSKILLAAGEVLDAEGYEGFNTTSVARRAGVSTATLYRHFSDKHAVLRALIVHGQQERVNAVQHYYDAFIKAPDWREPLAEATRKAWQMRMEQPGGRTARRALQMSPDLWQWDEQQNEEIARALARAMRRRKPALSRTLSMRLALVSVHSMICLLDLATLQGRRGQALVEEGIRMREVYLATYLDPDATPPA